MSLPHETRLAVSRADGTFTTYALSEDGSWNHGLEAAGWWPTWRPGSAQVAVSHVQRPGSNASRAVLRLHDIASNAALDVPGSVSAPASLIADRLAHYPLWSPTGSVLCYVSPAGRTLAARLWATGEAAEKTVIGGAPIFPAWSPTGSHLALHHGGSLTLIDAATGAERRLSDNAAGFRRAAFVDDGSRLLFAEPVEAGVRLRVSAVADSASDAGPVVGGGVAFVPRPGGSEVLIGVTPGDEAGVFSELLRFDPKDGREPERFLKGPFMACWWSPDGARLAVLVPSYTGDGRFQVRFHDAAGRFERAMEPTTLSQDMRTLVSFFDQYSLSHPLWSADGRYFAMGGRLLSDGLHASFAPAGVDYVVLADLEAREPWQVVGNGLAGFFNR